MGHISSFYVYIVHLDKSKNSNFYETETEGTRKQKKNFVNIISLSELQNITLFLLLLLSLDHKDKYNQYLMTDKISITFDEENKIRVLE